MPVPAEIREGSLMAEEQTHGRPPAERGDRADRFSEGEVRKSADAFPVPPVVAQSAEDLGAMQGALLGTIYPEPTQNSAAPTEAPGGGE